MMEIQPTEEIKKAMEHIQAHHPEIVYVVYTAENRWLYADEDFKFPSFGSEIDIGILEDASDSVGFLPSIFYMPK